MKRKLITLLMIIIISIDLVNAEEMKDITKDVEIRYKWYKEVIEGNYYPLKEQQDDLIVDINKIRYGNTSTWSDAYCNLSSNYYVKEYGYKIMYDKVPKVRYAKVEKLTPNTTIKIYQNNKILDYEIILNDEYLMIDLKDSYFAETLTFYIKNDDMYKISLYANMNDTYELLAKDITNESISIPDETWITENTKFEHVRTTDIYKLSSLTKKTGQYQVCRYREIYVYKYKITKEYYDDDYHLNVDGYIKDTNDYKIFYQEKPITNIVEITQEKIVKEPAIEYIYIPSENEIQKIDSSKEIKETECIPQVKTELKTEIKTIEKEIFKIPKKIYVVIVVLILIITYLIIKLIKKYVDQKY